MIKPGDTMGIVVAAYNAAATVGSTISSIKHQTDKKFRCIVVDDGSEDDTYKVIINAIGNDDRFRVIKQQNQGVATARNIAVSQLDTSYFFYVDADDTISFDFIAFIREKMKEYPGYEAYSPNAELINNNEKQPFYTFSAAKIIKFSDLCKGCCIIGGGTVVSREVFDELGGFDVSKHAEDYDFWLRFYASAYRVIAFSEIHYQYNVGTGQARRSDNSQLGIASIQDSLHSILNSSNLNKHDIELLQDALRKSEDLLHASVMHGCMKGQKEKIEEILYKVFGKKRADFLMRKLSIFAPLIRRFRIWFARRKVDKGKDEQL